MSRLRPPVTMLAAPAGWPSSLEVAGASHIGPVRSENQDAMAAEPLATGAAVIVADGMGGEPGGGEAARQAVAAALGAMRGNRPSEATARDAFLAAVAAVGRLRGQIGGHPGTTMTLALLDGPSVLVAHAGDSRAYLVDDARAVALTPDDSWVGERVRSGELPEGSERHHPRRNLITSAVTGDLLEPHLRRIELSSASTLLLCSDGFWDPLMDTDIAALLPPGEPLATAVAAAVEAALDAGGSDNVTVVAVRPAP